MDLLKRLAAHLPADWQWNMRRRRYARQIRNNTFRTSEPEYDRLADWLHPGDWAIDIGANIGHYTKRMSELVGPKGRVIAFEPIPTTFALLASNARYFAHDNVTLFNAAISDKTALCGMDIPKFSTGLANYYEAELTPSDQADTSVLSLSLDAFTFPSRIALIKIDAENHEYPVLQGMRALLLRDHPILIVETGQQSVMDFLSSIDYSMLRLPNSPNILFVQKA